MCFHLYSYYIRSEVNYIVTLVPLREHCFCSTLLNTNDVNKNVSDPAVQRLSSDIALAGVEERRSMEVKLQKEIGMGILWLLETYGRSQRWLTMYHLDSVR